MNRMVHSIATGFLLLFYFLIVMYVLFAKLHVDALSNFVAGVVFECIGFVLMSVVILKAVIGSSIRIGFRIPAIMTTVFYVVILNIINMVGVVSMERVDFVLANLVLLFVYCNIITPLILRGMIKDKETSK